MKKWTKKTIALSLVAIVIIGGGGVYAYSSSQSKQKLEAAQTEVKNQEATLKTLNRDLKGYFDKKSPSYLVENMQESKIKDLKKEVENATSLKETTLKVDHTSFDNEVEAVNKTMRTIETTFEQQQAVNNLFQGTAVNGAKILKELPIADDLKQETIDQVKKSVEKQTSDFEKTIQSLATEAENQVKQLDKAKQATEKVYKDKVISTDTKLYDTAKIEVNKIKNAKAKKSLSDQLSKVKKDIDKKEEETKNQEEQKANVEGTSTTKKNTQESKVVSEVGQENTDSAQTALNQETGTTPDYSGGGVDAGNTGEGGQALSPETNYPQNPTPPTNNGVNNTVTPEPTEPQTPTEPTPPTGPPAGWINPPFPVDSNELWNWIFDNGYSGYDYSDGYIRPY